MAFHFVLLLGFPGVLGVAWWLLDSCPELSSPGGAGLFYGCYLGILGGSIVVYRVGPFHPLARFKGPLAFRISKLWMAAWAAAGSECFVVKALHDKYGDVVRTGARRCLFLFSSNLTLFQDLTNFPSEILPLSAA